MRLSNRLRTEGIDCNIDQYETSPPGGWPRWMNNQIEEADFVLVVCTEQYQKRFKGKDEAEKGLGAKFESAIITQGLYDSIADNKFIPIVFSSDDLKYIPVVLRSATYYEITIEGVYDKLYACLTGQKLVFKPNIGKLRCIPPKQITPFGDMQNKKSESTKNKQKPKIGGLRKVTNKNEIKMRKDTQDKLNRKEAEINFCYLTNDLVRHTWYQYRNEGKPFNASLLRRLEIDGDKINELRVEISDFVDKIENSRDVNEFNFLTVAFERYLDSLDLDFFIETLLSDDAIKEIDQKSIKILNKLISY